MSKLVNIVKHFATKEPNVFSQETKMELKEGEYGTYMHIRRTQTWIQMNNNIALQIVNIVFTTRFFYPHVAKNISCTFRCQWQTSEPRIHKFLKQGLKVDYQWVETIWLRDEERDWCLFFLSSVRLRCCGEWYRANDITTTWETRKNHRLSSGIEGTLRRFCADAILNIWLTVDVWRKKTCKPNTSRRILLPNYSICWHTWWIFLTISFPRK